ncbi:MAG TPA: Fic family protein, partial [Fimbriimonadaceae bacterium]|nr:Fic family protein [Fimbriimonadaceae bacterium]
MSAIHYLTIQDVLWVHLQVTNKVESYDYARLEEAVFYQYAYGDSTGLLAQASRFLSGFMRQHPFEAGNEVTAFLSCAAFLRLNGKLLAIDAAAAPAMIESANAGKIDFDSRVADASSGEHLDTKGALKSVLEAFGEL